MALKGTTKIELTNVKTGEVEVIEKTNMVTNAVNDILSLNPGGFLFRDYTASAPGELQQSFAKTFFPICPNLIGGILLYNDALEEDPDKYFADQNNLVIGYSSSDVNTGADIKRGSMNQTESGPLDGGSGYRFVFDFETSQANGTISALGLTSPHGGCGHGSPNSNEDEYRKPLLCVYSYNESYSGAYAESVRIRPISNIVSIDPENNVGYYAYVSSEKTIVVGKVRMDLTSVGLRQYFPEMMNVIETNVIETKAFATVMYSDNYFYGTLIDGGDGYIWGFQHEGNAAGNESGNATVLWIKINKEDWSFEEGSWTIAAQLGYFGKVGDFSTETSIENNAVIKDGKLYILKYASDYTKVYTGTVYEIPLDNVTDVKAYQCASSWTYGRSVASFTRLNVINGKVRTRPQYIDGDILNWGYLRDKSNVSDSDKPSSNMCLNLCEKPGLIYGPYIFAFASYVTAGSSPSYYHYVNIYLQMCFLATINNLATPVQKTADKTMKITYILREE